MDKEYKIPKKVTGFARLLRKMLKKAPKSAENPYHDPTQPFDCSLGKMSDYAGKSVLISVEEKEE
jgi:hypothetical protein